jgi:predicted DCC family thiol-disulfide oxidoreductase YuxK
MNNDRDVLFYDGVCKFCNRLVNTLLRVDQHGRIHFSPLQGDLAKWLLSEAERERTDTVVYWRKGVCYRRSSAVIYALADASSWLKWVHVFRLIPNRWRDALYDTFARNRYRWFGRYDHCNIPSQDELGRFIP